MVKGFKRHPQPPIDRLRRASESGPAWPGILLVGAAIALIVAGTAYLRTVGGADAPMSEWQMMQAATVGGIQRAPAARAAASTQPTTAKSSLQTKPAQDFCPT